MGSLVNWLSAWNTVDLKDSIPIEQIVNQLLIKIVSINVTWIYVCSAFFSNHPLNTKGNFPL